MVGTVCLARDRRTVGIRRLVAVMTVLVCACGGPDLRDAGESCATNAECLAGLVCRAESGAPLRCAPPLAECAICSRTEDCLAPLVCNGFSDGTRRCGSGVGATTCRTAP